VESPHIVESADVSPNEKTAFPTKESNRLIRSVNAIDEDGFHVLRRIREMGDYRCRCECLGCKRCFGRLICLRKRQEGISRDPGSTLRFFFTVHYRQRFFDHDAAELC
jgi:hypothetical protein